MDFAAGVELFSTISGIGIVGYVGKSVWSYLTRDWQADLSRRIEQWHDAERLAREVNGVPLSSGATVSTMIREPAAKSLATRIVDLEWLSKHSWYPVPGIAGVSIWIATLGSAGAHYLSPGVELILAGAGLGLLIWQGIRAIQKHRELTPRIKAQMRDLLAADPSSSQSAANSPLKHPAIETGSVSDTGDGTPHASIQVDTHEDS